RLLLERAGGVLTLTRTRRRFGPLRHPARAVIRATRGIESGEQPLQLLWPLVALGDDHWCVRVVDDVLAETRVRFNDVADQSAEERNVAAGADLHVNVGNRARARVMRIDMDDRRAALARLHHPPRADRVRLNERG